MTSCNSEYLVLLVVNWLKQARRHDFSLLLGFLGHLKHTIIIERVILFEPFVVFAPSASLDHEHQAKSFLRDPQSLQKHAAENPRSALECPGGVPGNPKTKPQVLETPGARIRALRADFARGPTSWSKFHLFT